jgi:hypothetical protein
MITGCIVLLTSLVFVLSEFIYRKIRKDHTLSPIDKDVKLHKLCLKIAAVAGCASFVLFQYIKESPDVKTLFVVKFMPYVENFAAQTFMGQSYAIEKVVILAWVLHCKTFVNIGTCQLRKRDYLEKIKRGFLLALQGVVRLGVIVVVFSIYTEQQTITHTVAHLTITEQVLQWHVFILGCIVYVCGEAAFTIVNPISWGLVLGMKGFPGILGLTAARMLWS